MNLNHLAIFHAIVEEKSLTGAARRLLISQPAVSKQLRQFEKSLGVQLLNRRPRGVQPTEAGALLAFYAARLFALVEESQHAIAELRGLQRGRLRVGASTTIGVYLLPQLFVRFRAAHPGVQLQLEIAGSDALAARLLNGSIDTALTEGVISNDLVESEAFMIDRLVAIAPYKHPLARKRSITASLLCRQPFVVRETGSGTQSLVERSLAQRNLSVNIAMSLGSTEAIKRAVESGVGVAVVSSLTVALEVQVRKLAIIRIKDLNIQRPLHRLVVRNAYQSQSVRAFHSMLEAMVS